MRRGQKWRRDRERGYGPGLLTNTTSAEKPQAALDVPRVEWSQISDPTSWTPVPFESATVVDIDPNACPKCGRVVGRGRATHVKFCKGAA